MDRGRVEILSDVLEELGAWSVTWENAGDDEYFETAFPGLPHWNDLYVTALFDPSRPPAPLVSRVNDRIGEELVVQIGTLDDRDWERAWLTHFEPRKYRGDLWVCPSWIDPPDPRAANLIIDPGLAFGTGDHTTTALCLDWISQQDLSGATVLDFGCGSGILAIACLLKGAARAWGVDVDPRAVAASTRNAARNGLAEKYEALPPGQLPDDLEADLVVANILADVLIESSGLLTRAAAAGGWILLAGIFERDARRVAAAFESSFELDTRTRDQWCLLIGRKRPPPGGAAHGNVGRL